MDPVAYREEFNAWLDIQELIWVDLLQIIPE
jgi:hypothetical protein